MLRTAASSFSRQTPRYSRALFNSVRRASTSTTTAGTPPPSGGSSKSGSGGRNAILLTLAATLGAAGGAIITQATGDATKNKTPEFGKFGTREDFRNAIYELKETLGEAKVSTEQAVLDIHGFSPNAHHPGVPHSVVIFPESTEDVVKVVKTANKYLMPIVAFSGGTSLEGHFGGYEGGGICIDMSGMNHILKINGPGATIGGMAGTGCSGTNAVKYGTAKSHWFLNLTVVLPNGEVIKTRSRARKSSAGFDVTKLFIGAEGTLGIITEATIRLTPLQPTSVAVAAFPNVKQAASAVYEALNSTAGDSLQCIELVDDHFMAATNKFGQSKRKYLEKDSLFIKFQGSPTQIKENAKTVERIIKKHGGLNFELARNEQEATDLWQDRKNALWTSLAIIPGSKGWSTDVCVPVSRLPDLVYETKKDLQEHGIVSTIVGHVGDGNFHSLLVFRDDSELDNVRGAVHRMVERALKMEGTCTGEHGVGIGKREFLYEELGVGTVELMKTIKRAVDPHGLFNPGKLYPDDLAPGATTHHSSGKLL
ncbi:hypothetical protein FRC02_004184 [Tulasnella sp. 418]|nr:hypothetical protein FRC02_004184 [Tulasnella sp. 418]